MDNEIINFKPCPTAFTSTTTNTKVDSNSNRSMMAMSDITNKINHVENIFSNTSNNSSKGYSELAIVLVKSNNKDNNNGEKICYGCYVVNWHTGFMKASISYNATTAIAWSPKGDEFVCGFTDGSIKCYSPFGLQKYEIPAPPTKPRQQQQAQNKDADEKEKEQKEKENDKLAPSSRCHGNKLSINKCISCCVLCIFYMEKKG